MKQYEYGYLWASSRSEAVTFIQFKTRIEISEKFNGVIGAQAELGREGWLLATESMDDGYAIYTFVREITK